VKDQNVDEAHGKSEGVYRSTCNSSSSSSRYGQIYSVVSNTSYFTDAIRSQRNVKRCQIMSASKERARTDGSSVCVSTNSGSMQEDYSNARCGDSKSIVRNQNITKRNKTKCTFMSVLCNAGERSW